MDIFPESTYVTNSKENVRNLWLGLLAGPVIYALYFIISYLLAEATCTSDLFGLQPANLVLAIQGLTVVAVLLTLSATRYNYRHWRRHQRQVDDVGGALAFMAFGGLLLSLLFALLIGVTGIALFFINPCQWL